MSMKYLGHHFDIHGGGLDLVFPHHENELVQSECFTGVPFATYWLHNGLLTKEGKKISKSDPGTIVLMSDLLEAHTPDTLRVLLLSSHYRRPIDFGPTRLDEIERGTANLLPGVRAIRGADRAFVRRSSRPRRSGPSSTRTARHTASRRSPSIASEFLEAMDDDFNTGGRSASSSRSSTRSTGSPPR